jgi:glycosyltransferase involved in cell wall biosynthesis
MSERESPRVFFQTPPPERRVGGLDTALAGMKEALKAAGVEVLENVPPRLWPTRRNGRDLVHLHGLWEPSHGALVAHCRRHGVPYVVSPHGMLEPWAFRSKCWKKWPWFHLVEKGRLRGAAALLATGAQEAENLRQRLGDCRVVSLPLGVADAPSWQPGHRGAARKSFGLPEGRTVFLYLSRLDPKKGLHHLLRGLAHPSLAGWRQRAELWVVGGGEASYAGEVKRLAESLSSQLPTMKWMGSVWGLDRWKFLQAADLFCLPTHSENFGLAILEALLCGVPVLTTRHTPWAEEEAPGAISICDPEPLSVAEALGAWEDRLPLAEEQRWGIARWAAARFSWDELGPRYRAFYESHA